MIRRILALVTLLIVLAGSASAPPMALAGGPPIPPLRADGPVVLPNARVLPMKPDWVQESSVQAEMLAEHANDRLTFEPGARPRRLGEAGATFGLASGGPSSIIPLSLAAPSGAEAPLATTAALPNGMRKEILGFLPYWMLDAGSLQWMQYQLVTTIAYFGVAARADGTLATSSGGSPTPGWSGWNSAAMTNVINAAHAKGVRVVLTVTMMAWDGGAAQAALLGSATARAALVNSIVTTVRNRAADGVNLDFEPVSTTLRDQYTSFVRQLKAGLVAAGVGSYLTVCTMAGAATWSTGYDLAGLTAAGAANAVFVMGYDYSWSGSARAGGVAPMDSPYILDVRESVDDYLSIIPGGKIIWGVPYYGRTWLTTSNALNATVRAGTSGSSKAYFYTGARNLAAKYGRLWDNVGKVPWFRYYDSAKATWVEGYYDDAVSLAAKYDMVNQKNLAGTGMWTLLMDQGDNALWALLANKFVNDTTPPAGGIATLPALSSTVTLKVTWRATDVGSGVKSYSVQVHDRSTSTWVPWLTGTTATTASYTGVPGHAYDFRVAAVDYKGNTQPWLPSLAAPGATLKIGGFARVAVDTLNVRSGAGTGFSTLAQLSSGATVAVLAGPIAAGGYQWYQVQFDYKEWPSADYPRTGWAASGSGGTAYLVPTKPPNMITISATADPAPTLAARNPGVNATGVATTVQPYVRFDRVVTGVSTSTFLLKRTGSGSLAGTVTSAGDGMQYTFHPSLPLVAGATYTVTLSTAIKSSAGVALAPTSWNFTAAWPSGAVTFSPAVLLTFKQGTHTGYKFSSAGAMTAVKSYTLGWNSSAYTSKRQGISNQSGTWFYVSSGVWAGHWIRQSSVVYLASAPVAAVSMTNATFTPARTLVFKEGTHTGYRFSSTGVMTAQKSYTLGGGSSASTTKRQSITNQSGTWFYVSSGVWAGYWLRASDVVFLKP
ncbi:MAG: glycosyl hydrolase family 18 protein [Chloroflexota bacterium]